MTKECKDSADAAQKDLRSRLQSVFRSLETIRAVVAIAGEALSHQSADFDPEVTCILVRCVSVPLDVELKEINSIIESLGGKTTYSEEDNG